MKKIEVLKRIRDTGLIPVVRAESAELAMRAVAAIQAGGVDVLEVTMTVPGAIDVIAKLASAFGNECVIGAGTVLDPATANRCIGAGARFIVSPALNLETIACCRELSVAVIPGALTPRKSRMRRELSSKQCVRPGRGQYWERTGVPARVARVGWWMRPGNQSWHLDSRNQSRPGRYRSRY